MYEWIKRLYSSKLISEFGLTTAVTLKWVTMEQVEELLKEIESEEKE